MMKTAGNANTAIVILAADLHHHRGNLEKMTVYAVFSAAV